MLQLLSPPHDMLLFLRPADIRELFEGEVGRHSPGHLHRGQSAGPDRHYHHRPRQAGSR